MGDADPEHEVGDVDRPHDRRFVAGHAEAHLDLPCQAIDSPQEHGEDEAETNEIHPAGRLDRPENVVADLAKGHSSSAFSYQLSAISFPLSAQLTADR